MNKPQTSTGTALELLGHNVQYWRKVRGLTLLELANHTGIAPEALRGIENGTFDPPLDLLDRLADDLKVVHRQLFEQPGNPGRVIRG